MDYGHRRVVRGANDEPPYCCCCPPSPRTLFSGGRRSAAVRSSVVEMTPHRFGQMLMLTVLLFACWQVTQAELVYHRRDHRDQGRHAQSNHRRTNSVRNYSDAVVSGLSNKPTCSRKVTHTAFDSTLIVPVPKMDKEGASSGVFAAVRRGQALGIPIVQDQNLLPVSNVYVPYSVH